MSTNPDQTLVKGLPLPLQPSIALWNSNDGTVSFVRERTLSVQFQDSLHFELLFLTL
jgi:hypothetical protein